MTPSKSKMACYLVWHILCFYVSIQVKPRIPFHYYTLDLVKT